MQNYRGPSVTNYENMTDTYDDTSLRYDRINKTSGEKESLEVGHQSSGSSDDSYAYFQQHISTGETKKPSVDGEAIYEAGSDYSSSEDHHGIGGIRDKIGNSISSIRCSPNRASLKVDTSCKRNKKKQDYQNVNVDFPNDIKNSPAGSLHVPDRAHRPSGGLIEVPNYQLFSPSGSTEVGNFSRNTPDYENETMLFSKVDMTNPLPFNRKSKKQSNTG
jgi:hypothetical protein